MLNCETCGADVARTAEVAHLPELESAERLGKTFYGLSEEVALCSSCLEEMRLVGTALAGTERSTACPLCRSSVDRAA